MTHVLILNGHPHDDPDHFVHALAKAYERGAEDRHIVRRIDLAKLDIPLMRSPAQWQSGELPDNLLDAKKAIDWAEHLVILYPLWLGDMPALLKAFLEQIARAGFAVKLQAKGGYTKLLKGKSARLIVTMGMPALLYRLYYRAHSVKSMKRNILKLVGIRPIRTTLIGSAGGSHSRRKRWLDRVARLGWRAR